MEKKAFVKPTVRMVEFIQKYQILVGSNGDPVASRSINTNMAGDDAIDWGGESFGYGR